MTTALVINRFRELLPYPEVPIKIHFRGKTERTEEIAPNTPAARGEGKKAAAPARKPRGRPYASGGKEDSCYFFCSRILGCSSG